MWAVVVFLSKTFSCFNHDLLCIIWLISPLKWFVLVTRVYLSYEYLNALVSREDVARAKLYLIEKRQRYLVENEAFFRGTIICTKMKNIFNHGTMKIKTNLTRLFHHNRYWNVLSLFSQLPNHKCSYHIPTKHSQSDFWEEYSN